MTDKVQLALRTNMPDLDRAGVANVVALCKSEVGASYIAFTGIVKMGVVGHRLHEKQLQMKGQRVADMGNKLSFEQAKAYFPALKKSEYRR